MPGLSRLLFNINGGYLFVDAVGDGLDSNGYFQITGGLVQDRGMKTEGKPWFASRASSALLIYLGYPNTCSSLAASSSSNQTVW